ncbi:Uncharacterised protein [Klebsiella quasipneumoniae]|nr:Uncharacterised protein [Klebsiella quasipneumoniae]
MRKTLIFYLYYYVVVKQLPNAIMMVPMGKQYLT